MSKYVPVIYFLPYHGVHYWQIAVLWNGFSECEFANGFLPRNLCHTTDKAALFLACAPSLHGHAAVID